MNIYLDIDGVLLTKDTLPAKHVLEFLTYVTDNHEVYWLTTHCKGDSDYTIMYLQRFLYPKLLQVAKKLKPTDWNIKKTEAIDFTKPFLWFDDNLFEAEKSELIKHNALDNFIQVDLRNNTDQLQDFLLDFPIPIQLVTN